MDFRKFEKGELFHVLDNGAVFRSLPFQYNPSEITRTLGVEWKDPDYPGQFIAATSFLRHAPQVTSFELFFYNRSNGEGVEQVLAQLEEFVMPGWRYQNAAFREHRPTSPDRALLVMGPMLQRGVVENLEIRHRIFNRTLGTMCAEVQLTFRRISTFRHEEESVVANLRKQATQRRARPLLFGEDEG
jgi:hypothetical protein